MVTDSLREVLDRLEAILASLGAPVVDLLRPPTEIPARVAGVNGHFQLHPDVIELYRWHDGTDDIGGSAHSLLPGLWSFPPFGASLGSQLGLIDELAYSGTLEHWRESWFPVLNAGLSFVAVDCHDGDVWSSSISLRTAQRLAPSLAAFFDRVVAAFASGSFRVIDGEVVAESEDVETLEFLRHGQTFGQQPV